METSRIIIKGLPPNILEDQVLKHFSEKSQVTDVKFISSRRLAFCGFRDAKAAAEAVKYFNKTFFRRSRILVELARSAASTAIKEDAVKSGEPESKGKPEPKKRKADASKLTEYLELHSVKRPRTEGEQAASEPVATAETSEDEYEDIQALSSKKMDSGDARELLSAARNDAPPSQKDEAHRENGTRADKEVVAVRADATDDEWLRTRTNRVLDLVDTEETAVLVQPARSETVEPQSTEDANALQAVDTNRSTARGQDQRSVVDRIRETRRVYIRNLSYATTDEEIRAFFKPFGKLQEVHVPVDSEGRRSKGFAFVAFEDADAAVTAFRKVDGTTFQGRIIHILPARRKPTKDHQLDEFALARLPLKKQKQLKLAASSFNWNTLFMSQDAVNESAAHRLGLSKLEFLDPTNSSAAVQQATAETEVIRETRAYFAAQGVDLDAFKTQKRGEGVILAKNFKYGTTIADLRKMFEAYGPVLRILMPPSGTSAIVQFAQPGHAKRALTGLAYRRIGESVLFLEAGPQSLFRDGAPSAPTEYERRATAHHLNERDAGQETGETRSVFISGLAFATATESLCAAFQPLDGYVSAVIKTKTDPKGRQLSMGFGFVHFRSQEQALAAIQTMDGHSLDGHRLSCKLSRRGNEETTKVSTQQTKIIIKNLPFEVTKKDIRDLFSKYGQLRALRLPRKFDHSSRGFAFADFISPREAANAYERLKDTHFLGRRMVLEFAEQDAEMNPGDAIAKMQSKMGSKLHKVKLQQLMATNRKKMEIGGTEPED